MLELDLAKYDKELKELGIDLNKVAIAYKTTIDDLTDEIIESAIARKKEMLKKDETNGK